MAKNDFYIWEKREKGNSQLTTNFKWKDFECKCSNLSCVEQKISVVLIKRLQTLREILNTPIIVTSGYRCHTHNLKSGGVKNSTHRKGLAVDVRGFKTDKEKELWLAKAKELFDGVGEYKNFIHLDARGYKSHFKGKY